MLNATYDVYTELFDKSQVIQSPKNANNSSGIGSDTVQILADYEGSRFFSAERHLERSSLDQSKSPTINLETLQFNNILLGNSDEVTMEARHLLSQWMDRAIIDGSGKVSDKHSEGAVKDIIHELHVRPISVINAAKEAFGSSDLVIQ